MGLLSILGLQKRAQPATHPATNEAATPPAINKAATFVAPTWEDIKFYGWDVAFQHLDSAGNKVNAFKTCPPLSYILNQKAMMHNNGVIKLSDSKGNDVKRGSIEIEGLLKSPNPLQTMHQFRAQVTSIVQIYGYCPVLKITPPGFKTPTQLWILPPSYLTIDRKENYLFATDVKDLIKSITFKAGGEETQIDKENLYFFTDLTTSLDNLFTPDSRIEALRYPIGNLIKIYESRGEIIEHLGARGILSNNAKDDVSSIPMLPADKEALHKDWMQYGIGRGQKKIIITNASLSWQQIGMPFAELQLLEQAKDDTMTLCAALNFKFQLLPFGTETAFNNQDKAYKAQYQDSIIPEANNFIFQLSECMGIESTGTILSIDFTGVGYLQADQKNKSEVMRNNVQFGTVAFMNNLCSYTDLVALVGISLPTNQWTDRWWYQFTPDEKAQFINTQNHGNNNYNTYGGAGDNQGQGNNNQG